MGHDSLNLEVPPEELVSIGMPVRNGEATIAHAITSLLSQTHRNLRIRISDNASTDATPTICRKLASQDKRIIYERCSQDQGAIANFNIVLERAEGTYFMWAAHDDYWADTFLEGAIQELRKDPEAVGCVTGLEIEYGEGGTIERVHAPVGLESRRVRTRVRAALLDRGWFGIYGLLRLDSFPPGYRIPSVAGPDAAFIFGLVLRGRFVLRDEILFHYQFVPKPGEGDVSSLFKWLIAEAIRVELSIVEKTQIIWEVVRAGGSRRGHWRVALIGENVERIGRAYGNRETRALIWALILHAILDPISVARRSSWRGLAGIVFKAR